MTKDLKKLRLHENEARERMIRWDLAIFRSLIRIYLLNLIYQSLFIPFLIINFSFIAFIVLCVNLVKRNNLCHLFIIKNKEEDTDNKKISDKVGLKIGCRPMVGAVSQVLPVNGGGHQKNNSKRQTNRQRKYMRLVLGPWRHKDLSDCFQYFVRLWISRF